MSEDTWASISIALKSLLSKYDLDLTGVGATQRLAYTDFETIFYHLFMMIDPSDCRRKFWSLYPTRNQDERARFIDESTQFINSKQLSSQRVTPSQLRMCGGEPFRRLLISLIKKASESEIAMIDKRLPEPLQDFSISQLLLGFDQLKKEAQEKTEAIQSLMVKYSHLQEKLAKKEEETNQLWKILTGDNKESFYIDNKKPAREIYKSLLDKLEKNDSQRKIAALKIKQIAMPRITTADFNTPGPKTKVPTRMSYLFREIRQHLTLTPNNPSAEPPKHKEKENLSDQLTYYDKSVDELLSIWEIELEKADDALLANKDTKAKYVAWQQLIPFLDLSPICIVQDKKSLNEPVNLCELQEILKEYPDPRYDEDDILNLVGMKFLMLLQQTKYDNQVYDACGRQSFRLRYRSNPTFSYLKTTMSNIHALEPQAYGLIKFHTTFGDIDIELFTKQCPKITRNFVRRCLDKFYDKAKLHKLEKDFIAIIGEFNVNSDDSSRLPDEIHSRLRFTRRGLVATANTKKDANGPEFFFTLGPTQELQGKHTIFGRVKGDSLYNLVDLNECPVDIELRPKGDKVVNQVTVIENPFPDLEDTSQKIAIEDPDESEESSSDDEEGLSLDKNKKLSFFPSEDEDDEEEQEKESNIQSVSVIKPTVNTSQSQLKSGKTCEKEVDLDTVNRNMNDGAKEERLREIKAQIQFIKNQLEKDINTRPREPEIVALSKEEEYSTSKKGNKFSKDKRLREQETMELLKSFKKKLKQMHPDQIDKPRSPRNLVDDVAFDDIGLKPDELAALDQVDGDDWLFHKFGADEVPPKNNSSNKQNSSQDNSYHGREGHRKHLKRHQ